MPQATAKLVPVFTPRRPSTLRNDNPTMGEPFQKPDAATIQGWADEGWSYDPVTGGFTPNPGTLEKSLAAGEAADRRFLLAASSGPVASHLRPPPHMDPVASHAMPKKTTLGPAQEAIRVLALHLPKGPAPLAPAPAPVLPAPTPEDRVLRGLMAVMGHGQIEHPAQATTIDALLGALHGRR